MPVEIGEIAFDHIFPHFCKHVLDEWTPIHDHIYRCSHEDNSELVKLCRFEYCPIIKRIRKSFMESY